MPVPVLKCGNLVSASNYLVLLLLLLAQVAAIGVVFDNFLTHVIHSVHQELEAFLQVVTGGTDSHSHVRSNTVASEIYIITSHCNSLHQG